MIDVICRIYLVFFYCIEKGYLGLEGWEGFLEVLLVREDLKEEMSWVKMEEEGIFYMEGENVCLKLQIEGLKQWIWEKVNILVWLEWMCVGVGGRRGEEKNENKNGKVVKR